ncbi:MAG: FmdB family transcriptional regulator [Actinomycetota bacterium]|nr:FmdB family transcriptional regulator [Actinomycetota bacterium]
MPTYQYACTECGAQHEAVQSFSDPALTECPACAGRLRKVYGAVGVVFKGSGFYKTDSRSDGKGGAKAGAASEGGAGGASSDSGESSSGTSAPSGGSGSSGGSSSGSGASGGSSSGSSGSTSSSAPAKTA